MSTVYITLSLDRDYSKSKRWVENRTKIYHTKNTLFEDLFYGDVTGLNFRDYTKHPTELLNNFSLLVSTIEDKKKDAYLVGIQNRDMCEIVLEKTENSDVNIEFVFFDRRSIKMVSGNQKGISQILKDWYRKGEMP